MLLADLRLNSFISLLREGDPLVRQAAIVHVVVRIEDRAALLADEGRLRPDPFALFLLAGIGQETLLEVAHDLRILAGDIVRLAGVDRQVKKFGPARQQGDTDELPVAFPDRTAEGLDIDQDVVVWAGWPSASVGQRSWPSNG